MSNQKCCVPGCVNSSGKSEKETLHKFPHPIKYREMFNTWLYSVGGPILGLGNEYIFKYRRVCHIHFEEKYWCKNNRLSNIAVPTKNLPGIGIVTLSNTAHQDHGDHNYSAQFPEKRSKQPGKIDLTTDLNSTADDTKLTDDDLIFAAHAGENESTENTCFNEDEFIRANTTSNADAAENLVAEASRINEEGLNNNDFEFHDDGPQPTVPEPEKVPEAIFSWQKETDLLPTELMDDENDPIFCPSVGEAVDLLGPADFSMYCDDEPRTAKSQPEPITSQPEPITSSELDCAEYQCNECRQNIVGFRYTCVQCADWDLCGACEARTAHATHYVLRVPSPRPYTEIQAVLTAIRQQLLSENLFLSQNFTDDSLKVELKDEPPEAPPTASQPPPEPDPLEAEESDASSSPSPKRRSHRSLRSDETDENSAIAPREKPVLAVQEDDATISDHIDLTSAVVSDNDTRILASDKTPRILNSELSAIIPTKPTRIFTCSSPTRVTYSVDAMNKLAPVDPNIILTSENYAILLTVDNPASPPTQENLIKPLADKTCITASASDNISGVLACNKDELEQSNNLTHLFSDKNTMPRTYGKSTRISNSSESNTKLAYNTPKLLPTDSPNGKVVHDYLTKRASDNKEKLAEASPTPCRTVQQTDHVICSENTPNTKSIGNLNTVESHIDTLQSQIVGSNIVPLDASELPDKVKDCLETNQQTTYHDNEQPDDHQTIVLRVPSSTNDVDLVRALQSNVTVRLEPLRVEVIEYIPAKKKKTKNKL